MLRRDLWLVMVIAGCEEPRADDASTGTDASDSSSETSAAIPDVPAEPPPRPSYRRWERYEPEGAVCGNDTQYKFFANFSEDSDDVMVIFEPGGGCWDYPSCSGEEGILGAANPDGIPDDHLDGILGVHTPLLQREPAEQNPVADWNYVFVPYCTGDVHTGAAVETYVDADGSDPDLVYHHNGHDNTQAIIAWMQEWFPSIDRMLVTGCSAGGAGSLANYYFMRSQLDVQRGYLLDDSGPIFPGTGFSAPIHDKIRESWNIDAVLAEAPALEELGDDFGVVNTLLADLFPEDRLAVTFFRRDFNFSRYSYERFYDPMPTKDEVHEMWWADTQLLMDQFETRDNLAYYIPYWRPLNDSHCALIVTWDGTEIEEDGVNLRDFVDDLLDDDTPLRSYLEPPQPGEDE
jgi:hypothetical protein